MGVLRRGHLFAFAVALAAIACPRGLWDEGRLALLATIEGRPRRPLAEAGGAAEEAAALRAALARAERERADLARALTQATALREAAPGVRPEAIVPAAVRGGREAARAAARGDPRRGGRFRLDAGRKAGIEPGLAVTDGARLVGRIVAAGEGASEAEVLTAPAFRVRCRDARTGEDGLARGAGDGTLRFRPAGGPGAGDLEPGDAILTSLESDFAPPNLVIGTIVRIARDEASGLFEAVVRPEVDFARLDFVMVVRHDASLRGGGP